MLVLDGKKLTHGGRNPRDLLVQKVNAFLSGFGGLSETFSYSFISPKFIEELLLPEGDSRRNLIRILNPLSEDVSVMRTTLVPSMFSICVSNYSRGVKSARFYEIGKTYFPKAIPVTDTAIEKETLVLAAYGENESFYSLKSVLEALAARFNVTIDFSVSYEPFLHPYRQALVKVGDKTIGMIGEMLPSIVKQRKVDDRIYVAEIDLDLFIDAAVDFRPFVPVSKFPSIERDLALVVNEDVCGGDMLKLIREKGGAYLRSASIFDVYTGIGVLPGKKSVAFNLLFRKDEGTLDGEEVNCAIDVILSVLSEAFGAKLRD